MDRNKQTHSSDLLNIPGKNKTLGNMELVPSQTALSHPALSFLIAKLLADQKLTPKQHHQDEDTPMIPPPELRKTFKIDPNNDILSRVQSFLPQLQAANQQLQSVDPSKLDIENVEDDREQYIEMNLGLGVYDTKPLDVESSDENDDDDDGDNTHHDIVIPNTNKDGVKPRIELLDNDHK
ncbi:hypothetical protein [Absidia glauca]|uniref:Uncharacterized protein n=1 Tax=Absidia glauca TaxID=4829 RepID=A0A163K6Y5_ABSGL|nr:hypothetical protein [Absidia glauca]